MNQPGDYLRDGRELEAFINLTLDEILPEPIIAHGTNTASSSIDKPADTLDLFESSVKLAVRNVVKKLVTHDQNPHAMELQKCVYCLSDTSNIIKVCVCGLENVCFTCFMKRNMDLVIQHASPDLIVNKRICEHRVLELLKVITCQVCGDNSALLSSIQKYKLHYDETIIKKYDILHDINYYALENKQIFDHISNFDVYIKLFKHPAGLTEFGYALEISQALEGTILTIKLNSATLENILSKQLQKTNVACCAIKLNTKHTQYFVLDAIYYKCVEYSMAYLEMQKSVEEQSAYSRFLIKWNRLCCSINRLINVYMTNEECKTYSFCKVLLDILKAIPV